MDILMFTYRHVMHNGYPYIYLLTRHAQWISLYLPADMSYALDIHATRALLR